MCRIKNRPNKAPGGLVGQQGGKLSIIGALVIRIGFWGMLYYHYNKETLKYYR